MTRWTRRPWTTAWRVSPDGTTVDEYRVSFTAERVTAQAVPNAFNPPAYRYNRYTHEVYHQHFGETPQAAIALFITFHERLVEHYRTETVRVTTALVQARRLAMRATVTYGGERGPPA